MKVEKESKEAPVETQQSQDDLAQLTFFLPQEQKEWLMDRKSRGESASTILRTLVRDAMTAESQLAQAA